MACGNELTPISETEFSSDKTFGFQNSYLPEWIAEKTHNQYKSRNVLTIGLRQIRACDIDGISSRLDSTRDGEKIVVDSMDYKDLYIVVSALVRSIRRGKRFIFRTAASFVKAIGAMDDVDFLDARSLGIGPEGGLVIVGSHVKKTTEQLRHLGDLPDIVMVEFNQHLIFEQEKMNEEINRVVRTVENNIPFGKTTVIFTRRDRLNLNMGDKEKELAISVRISDAVTQIVTRLRRRPAFILAKGGITSSKIGTKGLGVREAIAAGQIIPGVPVWIPQISDKFGHMPYVIFPGNVGSEYALRQVVTKLTDRHE